MPVTVWLDGTHLLWDWAISCAVQTQATAKKSVYYVTSHWSMSHSILFKCLKMFLCICLLSPCRHKIPQSVLHLLKRISIIEHWVSNVRLYATMCFTRLLLREEPQWSWTLLYPIKVSLSWRPTTVGARQLMPRSAATTRCMLLWLGGVTRWTSTFINPGTKV